MHEILPKLISLLSLFALILFAWCMSSNRRRFPWRIVVVGVLLQFSLAALVLLTPRGALSSNWPTARWRAFKGS